MINVFVIKDISMMAVLLNAKTAMKLAKLVMDKMITSVQVAMILIIIGNFHLLITVYALKDIMIMEQFNVMNAIIHGLYKIK